MNKESQKNYNSFMSACSTDSVSTVKRCLPLFDLSLHGLAALATATRSGSLSVAAFLLDHVDAKQHESIFLRFAAEINNFEMVKLLLPFSDPKAKNSEAFRLGVLKGNEKIVDLLWDVSTAEEVLKNFKERGLAPKDYKILTTRLKIEKDQKELTKKLAPMMSKKPVKKSIPKM